MSLNLKHISEIFVKQARENKCNLETKCFSLVPWDIKFLSNGKLFVLKLKHWKCSCKFCKIYIKNMDYVSSKLITISITHWVSNEIKVRNKGLQNFPVLILGIWCISELVSGAYSKRLMPGLGPFTKLNREFKLMLFFEENSNLEVLLNRECTSEFSRCYLLSFFYSCNNRIPFDRKWL